MLGGEGTVEEVMGESVMEEGEREEQREPKYDACTLSGLGKSARIEDDNRRSREGKVRRMSGRGKPRAHRRN